MPKPRSPRRLLVALLALACLALPGPAAAESTGRGDAKATQSASAPSAYTAATKSRARTRRTTRTRRTSRTRRTVRRRTAVRRRTVVRRKTPAPTATPQNGPAGTPAPPVCPGYGAIPTAQTLAVARGAVLCLLNRRRMEAGLNPVQANAVLTAAAKAHTLDMVTRRYFQHVSPEGLGVRERLLSIGYVTLAQTWRVGENIAWGTVLYATPSSAVARWMGSPGHRENMLTPSFREVGIGIVPGVPRPDGSPGATYTLDLGVHS